MVPEEWGTNLARYLTDLTEFRARMRQEGIEPVEIGGRVVGVPIPFASDAFLGVIAWPSDVELGLQFLVAAASGEGVAVAPAVVAPQGVLGDQTTLKMPVTDHNPRLDGALEALFAAAEKVIGPIVGQAIATLPTAARAAVEQVASTFGIPFSASTSTVTVVLESRPGQSSASNVAALSALGISRASIAASSNLIKVNVSLSQLGTLVSQLAGVGFIRPPYIPYPLGTPSQGAAAIGADVYHGAGIRGHGAKIAVIDLGFAGLSQAQGRGDLPYSIVQNDLTGTGLASGITHGTAVAEIIYDIAPEAELYLIKIADEVDLDLAVTYCLDHGIDIINHSLGWYNTNFYDGTGTIAEVAQRAINGGIVWVNAAGNEAESHWEGTFIDGNSDGWNDQSVTFYASGGAQIVLYLTWNEWPQSSTDYDLYLYGPTGGLAASSTKHQTGTEEPTESVQITAPQGGTYTIRVRGPGGFRQLELFSLYQNVSPAVASSSILAPANVAQVVAVGAIDHTRYTTGPQEPYSSQGPTNSGLTKPDLCAPDNVSTGTAPYTTFPGTSGAAPHAAAAAALLLSQEPTLTGTALRSRLLSNTITMGSANIYGAGRLFLQPPAQPTQPPTASFTFSPSSPTPGVWVQFDGSGSTDPDGSIVSYAWQFGDGATGTGASAYHRFSSAGSYTVRLTVTDDDGASDTTTRTIAVGAPANQPPTASFTVSPSSPAPGVWVQCDGSGSSDPDGSIVSYAWQFGDGATGTGSTAQHAYGAVGTYTVRLTVTDDRGASDTATRQLSVQTAARPDLTVQAVTFSPPSPSIGSPVTVSATIRNVGAASAGMFRVRLQGAASSTQTFVSGLAAGASRSISLALPLTTSPETFTLTADDLGQVAESNEGNNTASVTVFAAAPGPPAADAGGPYSGQVGSSIGFNGTGSSGSISGYSWTFGDGGSASGPTPSHVYGSPGTYTVTLTVTGPGGQSTDTAQATVSAAPQPDLAAELSLPKTTYQVDETIVITFTLNRSATVYLCDVSPDGTVTLLYPNKVHSDSQLAAGEHRIPREGAPYRFRISEPTGTERLYLFAATGPIPGFPTSFAETFVTLSDDPTAFRDGILATMQSHFASGNRAFDELAFEVTDEPVQTGRLVVTSTPPGASVYLDEDFYLGTTPLDRSDVPVGWHDITVELAGYQAGTYLAHIVSGAVTELPVTLERE